MSSLSNTASTSTHFDILFNAAYANFTEQTGKDIRNDPLAYRIDCCDGPDSILHIYQEQSREFDEFRKDDTKLFKWLRPIVNVLHAVSTNAALSHSGSVVRPSTFVIVYSVYLNSVFPRRFRQQSQFSLVSGSFYPCVSPSLSPPHSLSHLGIPGSQGCEVKLQRLNLYLRMH